jgi:hypothetical protein
MSAILGELRVLTVENLELHSKFTQLRGQLPGSGGVAKGEGGGQGQGKGQELSSPWTAVER